MPLEDLFALYYNKPNNNAQFNVNDENQVKAFYILHYLYFARMLCYACSQGLSFLSSQCLHFIMAVRDLA